MNWEVLTMRSKTLSSELTLLRKDLTRFAPAWLGLCAYLMIWASTIFTSGEKWGDYYEPIAPIFAPIFALVLFGYLCDPRECNMVHSLPIRREKLFLIHTLAACLMFLIPTGIFCAVTRDFAVQKAIYRFLFMGVEFLLLFSVGILSMMFTGRKIGAALLYIFIQSFTIIQGLIIDKLYLPLLPGVAIREDWILLSPMFLVSSHADFTDNTVMNWEEWSFLLVFTLVSLAILGISVLLYRRRKLEHAGDLLAVSWLDPFFAACSCLTGASVMVLFDYEMNFVMLLLGSAIGYLSYWMLSKKTARVFTPKILGGYACLIAVLLGSMYLTYLDPLGRVGYVPEPHQVKEATLGQYSYDSEKFATSDPALIADLTALHADILEHNAPDEVAKYSPGDGRRVFITYKLNSGRTIQREYYCSEEALLDRASWFLSQPEAIFQRAEPEFGSIRVRCHDVEYYFDPRLMAELQDVILTECRAGRMFNMEYSYSGWTLSFELTDPVWYTYIDVPTEAVDTLAWLEANCVKPE